MRYASYTTLAAAGLILSAAAGCTSSGSGGSAGSAAPGAPVTISVNCEPPTTQAAQRQFWIDDVQAFEKQYPYITIKSDDANPCDNPATFDAKLAGGTMDNLFYTYFTDADNVISSGQVADIQKYVGQISGLGNIQSSVANVYRQNNTPSGDLYGVPVVNYTMGLLYNRTLFQRAGLNPDDPPTTWAEVETDAKAISALGNGIVGYGDYSAGNTGGWHFAAEMYSRGGNMVTADGKSADFDNATGLAVLQYLHTLRYTDNVMGAKQLLQYSDLLQEMGAGKLGMYIAAPDNVTSIHQQYNAPYTEFGMGPMPGGAATLLGGDGYMFNKSDTPAQIQAGLKWINFEFLTSGKGQFDYQRAAAAGQPVGLPQPDLWTGATATADAAIKAQFATIPADDFAPYIKATPNIAGRIEPPQAQAIYAQGDKVMSAVLTNPNANLQQLLDTFKSQVNSILANSQ